MIYFESNHHKRTDFHRWIRSVFSSFLSLSRWNGTWISDKYFTYLDTNKSIWIFNCETLKSELILPRNVVHQEVFSQGIVSPSARFILLPIRKVQTRPFYTEFYYDIYEKSTKIGSINNRTREPFSISALVFSNSDNLFVKFLFLNVSSWPFCLSFLGVRWKIRHLYFQHRQTKFNTFNVRWTSRESS